DGPDPTGGGPGAWPSGAGYEHRRGAADRGGGRAGAGGSDPEDRPRRQRQDAEDSRGGGRLRPPPPALPQADHADEQVPRPRRARGVQTGRCRPNRRDASALEAEAVGGAGDRGTRDPDL
ncbi:MAG: SSU ribosomal protein S17p (S11e), partial [uncultured Thermomicrobiales bacterium]